MAAHLLALLARLLHHVAVVLRWLTGLPAPTPAAQPAEPTEPEPGVDEPTGRHEAVPGQRSVWELVTGGRGAFADPELLAHLHRHAAPEPVQPEPDDNPTEPIRAVAEQPREPFGADDQYAAELHAMVADGNWPTLEDLRRYADAATNMERLVCAS